MSIGILSLHLRIPACASLKEKRGRLKPILAALHRKFNVSAAEIDLLDSRQDCIIACALVSNDKNHVQRVLQKAARHIETNWPNIIIINQQIELL